MSWYRRLKGSLRGALERSGRARVLTALEGMDPDFLKARGFSPELLRKGVQGWPWQMERVDEVRRGPTDEQFRQSEAELGEYSDAELDELGVCRRDIREVVRTGRPGIDDIAA